MKFKTSKHIYAHIDCDSFFASCEILLNPALKGKYVCVGEEIIVAATYNAKKLGIKIGTPIWEAKKILRGKDVYFAGHNMPFYSKVSKKLMQYLRDNTYDVRIFSIDEAFVEISGLPEMYGMHLYDYIRKLQDEILEKVGVPVSIGVSNTRLKAKIFSKVEKPFGVCIGIDAAVEKSIFREQSFHEIPFVGRKTSKKLDFSITTIQDYIELGYFEIVRRFGKNGGKIWLELRGVSSMGFLPKKQAKSIGRSRAFNKKMTTDKHVLLQRIQANLERLFDTLHSQHYEIGNITLILIDKNWKKYKISHEFETYTHDRQGIFKALKKLLDQLYTPELLYRKTGVFSNDIRCFDTKQLSLFEKENIQFQYSIQLENTLFQIQKKYGKECIKVGM